MTTAPLSAGAWEVLRALVLGIRIREFSDGWRAVGPWQNPSSSGIDTDTMGELLNAKFVERQTLGIGHYAIATDSGQRALSVKTAAEIKSALKWASCKKSRLWTS
jgi:hypothetical protein